MRIERTRARAHSLRRSSINRAHVQTVPRNKLLSLQRWLDGGGGGGVVL